MHFFIHNSFNSGDVILTRLIIITLRETYPELKISLECRKTKEYLWEDLGLPIFGYDGSPHTLNSPTPNCPPEAVFINMWFGLFSDFLINYQLTYENNVHTFNRQMGQFHLDHRFQLPVPLYPPGLKFFQKPEIDIPIEKNSILVENGPVYSTQSFFPINDYLAEIAANFPQYTFYCSTQPSCQKPNIIDCSHFNLIQLSGISNQCMALLTRGSGVNAATYTETNRKKPRCLVGMAYSPFKIWDSDQSNIHYANDLNEIFQFLHSIGR